MSVMVDEIVAGGFGEMMVMQKGKKSGYINRRDEIQEMRQY